MNTKKKSAAVLAHRDAKTGGVKRPANHLTYSLTTALRDVKRLFSGALGLLAAVLAMLSYGSAAERMWGWLWCLPCCVVCTLAAVWLWRQAERGDGRDE